VTDADVRVRSVPASSTPPGADAEERGPGRDTREPGTATVATIFAGSIRIPRQASEIVREWASRDTVDVTCQNCGLSRHDPDASHCKACGEVIFQEYDGRE
jgi:voltage-gated potassium channel